MAGRIPRVTEDIELYRGDSYVYRFEVTDEDDTVVDLSTYTYAGMIRLTADGAQIAEFTFDDAEAADGILTAIVDAVVTETIELPLGTGVYDIQVTDAGIVHTVRAGGVTLVKDVTYDINSK